MELLLKTMKRHFPQLNRKPYGLEDVEKIALAKGVHLKFAPYNEDILGYFCIDRSRKKVSKHIVINDTLGPIMRDVVSLHEICHFFYHAPVCSQDWFYCRKSAEHKTNKHDCEADMFALIAMIPLSLLIELNAAEYIEPDLIPLCTRRQKIWKEYGL